MSFFTNTAWPPSINIEAFTTWQMPKAKLLRSSWNETILRTLALSAVGLDLLL